MAEKSAEQREEDRLNPVAVASALSISVFIILLLRGEWILAGGIALSFGLSFLPGPAVVPLGIMVIVMLGCFYRGAVWAGILLAVNLGIFVSWARRNLETGGGPRKANPVHSQNVDRVALELEADRFLREEWELASRDCAENHWSRARAHFRIALQVAKESKLNLWIAPLMHSIAMTHWNEDDYVQARDLLLQIRSDYPEYKQDELNGLISQLPPQQVSTEIVKCSQCGRLWNRSLLGSERDAILCPGCNIVATALRVFGSGSKKN